MCVCTYIETCMVRRSKRPWGTDPIQRFRVPVVDLPFLCCALTWPERLPAIPIAFRIHGVHRPIVRLPYHPHCSLPALHRPCNSHCWCCHRCFDNDCHGDSDNCTRTSRQSFRVFVWLPPNGSASVCCRAVAWSSYLERLFVIGSFFAQWCSIRLFERKVNRENELGFTAFALWIFVIAEY